MRSVGAPKVVSIADTVPVAVQISNAREFMMQPLA
jgi:hypothetical protein